MIGTSFFAHYYNSHVRTSVVIPGGIHLVASSVISRGSRLTNAAMPTRRGLLLSKLLYNADIDNRFPPRLGGNHRKLRDKAGGMPRWRKQAHYPVKHNR